MLEFLKTLIINFGIGAGLGITVALIIRSKSFLKQNKIKKDLKEKIKKENELKPSFIEKLLSN